MALVFSQNFESTEYGEGNKEYLERMRRDLEAEIERILEDETKIGEGKTARVFSLAANRFPLPICVKIWKPDVTSLKEKNLIEYRKMQAGSPEDEFTLQDSLYRKGFRTIPRPIAFERMGEYQAMAMEELPGYTLEQIRAAGAIIEKPTWKELEQMIFELNINQGVLHRDLGDQNIFLKTSEQLSEGGKISGELYLIDFGLSKKISGTPDPEDYTLTIGNHMVKYPSDQGKMEALKPRPGKSNIFAH